MLHSLLPKAHAKTLVLPLLGPIADGFDDWLVATGYTAGSRRNAIRMLPHVDNDLRKRRVRTVSELNRHALHASWRHLIKHFPQNAGAVRSLQNYLTATGKITTDITETIPQSVAEKLSDEYAHYLREVRGFAIPSMANHRRVSRAFLDHLDRRRVPLRTVQAKDIEVFVTQAGKRLCRGTLQHEIAALRGLLRFLALDRRVPTGLDKQIDTPRLYRLEQLPRALPWPTVIELLNSIDLTSDIGLRDYACFS
jgi:integrase/recombinase XerD